MLSIRALQTADLRLRKFSGRHQINTDGKHLIDGVAFGRPYLRSSSRPAIRIPPRKRQRITHGELDTFLLEQESDSDINPGNKFIENEPQDASSHDSPAESDSDSLSWTGEVDLDQELRNLRDEAIHRSGPERTADSAGVEGAIFTRSRKNNAGLGLSLPYYGPYYNPLLDQYSQYDPVDVVSPAIDDEYPSDQQAKFLTRSKRNRLAAEVERSQRRISSGSSKSVRFEDEEIATPATVRLSELSEDEDDSDFEPREDDESDKENTQPTDLSLGDSDEASFVPSEEDEDSYSQSSSSTSNSDTAHFPSPGRKATTAPSQAFDSTRESYNYVQQAPSNNGPDSLTGNDQISAQRPATQDQEAAMIDSVPPNDGKIRTQKRNHRKAAVKKLKKMIRNGKLPQGSTVTDLEAYRHAEQNTANSDPGSALERSQEVDSQGQKTVVDADEEQLLSTGLSTRRDAASPARHRLSDLPNADVILSAGKVQSGIDSYSTTIDVPDSYQGMDKTGTGEQEDSRNQSCISVHETSQTQTESPKIPVQRPRLDIASSKRMLFGSLGLRTPKTKEEEEALRAKLTREARVSQKSQIQHEPIVNKSLDGTKDSDDWQSKIDLKAVECCHEGVVLSEPPFPFVQRWDPQQQRGYQAQKPKKNKKGKKRKLEIEVENDGSYGQVPAPKYARLDDDVPSTEISNSHQHSSQDLASGDHTDDFQNQSFQDSIAANEQLIRETNMETEPLPTEADELDLPDLPEDLISYPRLDLETCRSHAIIAFKRFLMSAETRWQPRISDYVTAAVDELRDNGTLTMTLARRDQTQTDVQFDQETGQRLYAKFEMPGYDEEGQALDRSKLELPFNELIEPRLIKAGKESLERDRPDDVNGTAVVAAQEPSSRSVVEPLDQPSVEMKPVEATEGPLDDSRREEISELIRDAGWKSSIDSRLGENSRHEDDPALMPSESVAGTSLLEGEQDLLSQEASYHRDGQSSPVMESNSSYLEAADSNSELQPQNPAASDLNLDVSYPDLSEFEQAGEVVSTSSQQRRTSIDADEQEQSRSSISPPPKRTRAFEGSQAPSYQDAQHMEHPISQVDGIDESEEEFPELFSQAFNDRMSGERTIKDESSQSQPARSIPRIREMVVSKGKSNHMETPDTNYPKTSSPLPIKAEESDSYSLYEPPYSQGFQSSQYVDLTLSSDAEPMETTTDENDNSYIPAKSPGWINKPKANRSIGVATRSTSRMQTRI